MIQNELVGHFGSDDRFSKVRITGGKYPAEFIIDNIDQWILKNHTWTRTRDGYIVCTKHSNESLHRLILKAKKGQVCDHKNRNTLDNRKSNLRIVSHADNMRNRSASSKSLVPVKGVSISGNKWRSEITFDGKRRQLGQFDDLYDAVCARIRAEIELFKDKSVDYKSIVRHIPATYLKFWFPEIYGKQNQVGIDDEFVTNFLIHKKERQDRMAIRYKLKRYRLHARSGARFEIKKRIGQL